MILVSSRLLLKILGYSSIVKGIIEKIMLEKVLITEKELGNIKFEKCIGVHKKSSGDNCI